MQDRLLDKEEFQAWRDSPATQWFLARLKAEATDQASTLTTLLMTLTSYPPDQWAAEQPQASYSKGYCEGLMSVVERAYEDLLTDEELEALKEKSKE